MEDRLHDLYLIVLLSTPKLLGVHMSFSRPGGQLLRPKDGTQTCAVSQAEAAALPTWKLTSIRSGSKTLW